jgi:hypothetical protein
MRDFILKNASIYLNWVYMPLQDNRFESENALLLLMERLDIDEITLLLDNTETRFIDIEKVDQEHWNVVLHTSKLIPTWKNLLAVFLKEDQISEEMVQFLNMEKNYQALAEESLNYKEDQTEEKSKILKFAEALMIDSRITDTAVNLLLDSYGMYFSDINVTDVSYDRMKIILDHDRFYFNATVYSQIQEHFAGLQLIYIETNKASFFEKIDTLDLLPYDYELILTSTKLSTPEFDKIIARITPEMVSENEDLAFQLATVLQDPSVATSISFEILSEVFNHEDEEELLVGIMNKYLPILTNEQAISLMKNMGEKFKEITQYKNPKFKRYPGVEMFLDRLQDRRLLVSTIGKDAQKLIAYTKQKPK